MRMNFRASLKGAGFVCRTTACATLFVVIFFGAALHKAGAANVTVMNTNDTGQGSLRQALIDVPTGGTIDFAAVLNGQTITLTSGHLVVSKSMTISGPGADKLTVNQTNPSARVIDVNSGAGTTINISGLKITGGNVFFGGGGIFNEDRGTLNLTSIEVSGNASTNGNGGGVANSSLGTLNIQNSTIAGNSAGQLGGGVAYASGGGSIVNSTISGNTAGASAVGGGGLGIITSNPVTVSNCTITNNTSNAGASTGGGVNLATNSAVLTLTSTIVAGNLPSNAGEISGTPQSSSSFNLIGNDTGLTGGSIVNGVNGNQIGTAAQPINPLLGPLEDNGGPTRTHQLLSHSRAVDAGTNSLSLSTDQRGLARTVDFAGVSNPGDGTDIGAVEVQLPTVTNDNDSGAGSLRQALIDAFDGATVEFSPALDGSTITLTSGQLTIDKKLTIRGPGADRLTVHQTTPNVRVFDVTAGSGIDVNISGLKITGGNDAGGGGGVTNEGGATLTLFEVEITGNNTTGSGAGVRNVIGSLNIQNSTIAGNAAGATGGGVQYQGGSGLITNSTISANLATTAGGGLRVAFTSGSGVTVRNSTISNNTCNGGANSGGGVSVITGAVITLSSTIIAANSSAAAGDLSGSPQAGSSFNLIGNDTGLTGGTVVNGTNGNQVGTAVSPIDPLLGPLQNNGGATRTRMLLQNSPAIDAGDDPSHLHTDQRGLNRTIDFPAVNNAGDGTDIGAVEVQLPTVTNTNDSGAGSLRQAIFDAFEGATIDLSPLSGSIITLTSGQLFIDKSLTINGPGAHRLTVNNAVPNRSVFFVKHSSTGTTNMTISGLRITGGNGSNSGGGIFNEEATLTLSGVEITGNSTTGTGGGIRSKDGVLNVQNSTIAGNTAASNGGGVQLDGGSGLIINSTISGNTALTGGGLNIQSTSGNGVLISNSTLSDNTATGGAGHGAGINAVSGTTLTLSSTIVADEHPDAAGDINGSPQAGSDNNLIGNDNGLTGGTIVNGVNGNQVGTAGLPINPLLGPLQDNGGPTDTHALLFGSPAVDAGINPLSLGADQRNLPRTVDLASVQNVGGSDGTDIGAFELQPSHLLNISTRMRVLTGDNVLIGGFIVTGTDDKKVIIRGIGPSLTNLGVPDALQDPTLELHDSTGAVIAFNDNWKDTQQTEIQMTGIPPTDDRESAIVATLPVDQSTGFSGYTAILRGLNDTTGVGLVEVFDLDQAANSKLANISTRGFVDTGDNVMIGGLIAGGGGSINVLLRAIGPSLASSGVSNALQDPTLELHDGSGAVIAFNDNWKDSQQTEIEATTIPPGDDRESAIVATLAPGNYTAIVRGSNNTTGVALVEAFNLP
jgi:hypothetical protein